MKLPHIITLLIAAFIFAGCNTTGSSSASSEEATATGETAVSDSGADEKTAYEGSTGSGLLMERYKSGRIEGFRE